MRLDTERSRDTPEGVSLSLRVAGAPARGLAWALDLAIIFVISTLFGVLTAFLGSLGAGLYLIVFFLLIWGYGVVFELYRDGATPGKRSLGLRVVHDDGTPVSATASILRNFLRFADFLPFAYGAGLVSMLIDRDCRRLGDLAAGTLVIHDRPERFTTLPSAPPIAPPVALSRAERSAIVSFASRLGTWSPDRRIELADLVPPLTHAEGREAVQRLLGMAHHLLGRRTPRKDGLS